MPRTVPGSVKARFEAIVREVVAPALAAQGFEDVTKVLRPAYPSAMACIFERRFGDVWHRVNVQRDKYITSDHYRFTLNLEVGVKGFGELRLPRVGGAEQESVFQGRPAMLTRDFDLWWDLRASQRDSQDARVGAEVGEVIGKELMPLLAGVTTVEGILGVLEHPTANVARACMLTPLSIVMAGILCALTGRTAERDRFFRLARERAHLGPGHFGADLDALEARLKD